MICKAHHFHLAHNSYFHQWGICERQGRGYMYMHEQHIKSSRAHFKAIKFYSWSSMHVIIHGQAHHAWAVLICMMDKFCCTAKSWDMSTQNCQDINAYSVDLLPVIIIYVGEGWWWMIWIHVMNIKITLRSMCVLFIVRPFLVPTTEQLTSFKTWFREFGKHPLLGKRPCTAFHGINVVAPGRMWRFQWSQKYAPRSAEGFD